MTHREKGQFIMEKIEAFPYSIIKNIKSKLLRQITFMMVLIVLGIIIIPLIPYFMYLIFAEMLNDL